MEFLGIDIGGTFIKYAVIDDQNKLVRQWKKDTIRFEDKDSFYDYVCQDVPSEGIARVGISAPGVLAQDSTVISKAAPNVQIMYGTNVNEEFHKRLKLPVSTVNDAKSAGFCEMKIGNGKGSNSSAYFVIGTGVGGCLCNASEVIEGVDRIAGEFSHIPIGFDPENPYRLRELSDVASMTALIEIYNKKAGEDKQKKYGREITELYLNGDETAASAVEEWCRNIVWGLNIITILYNPEIICLGGGISKEDWFIEKIRDMYESKVEHLVRDIVTTKIDRCRFDNDANLLGAVLYTRQQGEKERQ